MPEYYLGDPVCQDRMWAMECASVYDHCRGIGLDPGAGGRTLCARTVRLDRFVTHRPHAVADAVALPFRDKSFGYVFNSHLLEHLADPRQAITEWLRVVRPGGVVAMIIPDTRFTKGQNTDPTPHLHEWSPRALLHEVFDWDDEDVPWYHATPRLSFAPGRVVQCDEGCPQWSLSVVVEKDQ